MKQLSQSLRTGELRMDDVPVPFMQSGQNIVQVVHSLISAGSSKKYLFKRAMEGILPPEVIWRGKAGFGAPAWSWLKEDLRPMIRELLSEETIKHRGYFEPGAVQRMIDQHATGQVDRPLHIWALMTLEIWMRIFLDGEKSL